MYNIKAYMKEGDAITKVCHYTRVDELELDENGDLWLASVDKESSHLNFYYNEIIIKDEQTDRIAHISKTDNPDGWKQELAEFIASDYPAPGYMSYSAAYDVISRITDKAPALTVYAESYGELWDQWQIHITVEGRDKNGTKIALSYYNIGDPVEAEKKLHYANAIARNIVATDNDN